MLVLSRLSATLTPDERAISTLLDLAPRTSPRPTNQRSGELTGERLATQSAPCIADEVDDRDSDAQEEDIAFSPVPNDAPASAPLPTPSSTSHIHIPTTTTTPPSPTGALPMHIKQYQPGGVLLQAFTTDLALLALALRHAAESDHLLILSPLMPTTLESLAATFELGTLVSLAQSGHLRLGKEEVLGAEAVQALCQRLVVEGVEGRVTVGYATTESVHPAGRDTASAE